MNENDQNEAPRQAIDLQVAMSRIPGGVKAVQGLAEVLAAESERLVEEIRAGISAGDAARVKLAAHSLRGSADVYAAQRVVQAAQRLESLGSGNSLVGAEHAVTELQAAVAEMTSELRRIPDPPASG